MILAASFGPSTAGVTLNGRPIASGPGSDIVFPGGRLTARTGEARSVSAAAREGGAVITGRISRTHILTAAAWWGGFPALPDAGWATRVAEDLRRDFGPRAHFWLTEPEPGILHGAVCRSYRAEGYAPDSAAGPDRLMRVAGRVCAFPYKAFWLRWQYTENRGTEDRPSPSFEEDARLFLASVQLER